ncbi:MAG TPA: Swt1 family HEPN domain-containing protein [Polyangiaceae bacterium LLY-WYZ-15_(1-7)]|nr:Swt1 family HEPN domain-containing protein [Polyangiaceae bacterium LLY-WYZ-15_(1-7)]HJL06639.1 Swt1 family HEPN domain-containing protein [Polyangiaceae bacterium LLY-WYZ-15_(1-7)]HJL09245.1 Swt1 family HEPN domain-containing protein [Polyangiaceae bacterium LLY-WYZ-15_(1-7)]HJL22638.1 Swt1 family HEPN domain-containing protein [Polyangiaceae bacterium LLY-WYZ-15_(1-7)]
MSNRARVGRTMELLTEGLTPFVERELKSHLGGYWVEKLAERTRVKITKGSVSWDAQSLLKAMVDNWRDVFRKTLGHGERAYVGELIEHRNAWAHEEPFSSENTDRALDTAERLLASVGAPSQAEEIAKLKMELRRTVYAEQARQQTRRKQVAIEGSPQAGLKPWRTIVTPHPDVASGRYMQAEFAADLAQVHRKDPDASEEYRDPVEFFRRTFVTAGLSDLLVGALQRLSGQGSDPVVELQTNFGGGKTHSMLALYHLFGPAQTTTLPGIEPVLEQAGVDKAVEARRAVLVGTALAPAEVSKKPDGTEVRTLWGEMAWQLGGKEGYAFVADSDKQGTSPGSDTFTELFRKFSPCLVLIDEWVAYARQLVDTKELPAGRFEAQASFAQALTEAAKAAPSTLVVASIPASKIEIGGDNGAFALETLKNVFERVGKAWRPASADEGFEIVRRRLFEPISDKEDFAGRDAVIDAFSKMYRQSPAEFPAGCAEGAYRRELQAAYPIHPELFRRLYDDWSTLDKFQRTRGVLRLLAKVIHRLWENQDGGLLIMPSSIPLDDGAVKSEVTRYLDDFWEPIISKDVDGPSSLPLELDQETPNLGRYSATRRVARTLYMGTAPGARSGAAGIDDRSVRLGCVQPGESAATFGDALRRLSGRARYIHQEGNRYWVSARANLNRTAEDRANSLLNEPEELHAEIVKRLRADKHRGDFAAMHPCPLTSSEVADEPEARLVIIGPTFTHRKGQEDSGALKFAKEMLESRGSGPRLNRNMLVFLAPDTKGLEDLMAATAQFLAWKSIVEDEETLDLTAAQRNQAAARRDSANETVNLRIGTAWSHILAPHQKEPTADISWEELRSTSNDALANRTSAKLKLDELLMPVMGGSRLRMEMDRKNLWAGKDHVRFDQLAEYFARYLYLPRVVSREVLRAAVANGAEQLVIKDTFAIATDFDEDTGRYRGLKQGGAIGVVIDNTTLLVRPEAAEAQAPSVRPPPEGGDVIGGDAPSGPDAPGGSPAPDGPQKPNLFVASVSLDASRLGRDAGRIAEEVLQHLSTLPGADVEVTLEMQVRVRDGVEDDVVRTVTENCNTLKFKSHGFERE